MLLYDYVEGLSRETPFKGRIYDRNRVPLTAFSPLAPGRDPYMTDRACAEVPWDVDGASLNDV